MRTLRRFVSPRIARLAMPLALLGACTSVLLAPGVISVERTILAYGELARTICFSLVTAALAAVPVQRASRIRPWMILAALGAALLTRLALEDWLPRLSDHYRQLLIVVLELGPLLLGGLRSLAARSSLWRVRGAAAAALAMITITGWGTRLGPGMAFHCFGPSLSPGWVADGVMAGQGIRLAGAALAAALFALAAQRERRRLRRLLRALALGCGVIAVRDALTLEAARRVMASLTELDSGELSRPLSPPFDVWGIERLGELATAWDVIAALALGVACALALLACLGQRGRRTRLALRSIALALPIGAWLLGPATDPPLCIHSTLEWVEPVWRPAEIDPPVADRARWDPSIPEFDRETWVAGRSGEILARYDKLSEPIPSWPEAPALPQIVADARAPLRAILAQLEERGSVDLIVRTPRAVELESATVARARFPFVEAATRELDAIELLLIDPEEHDRLIGEAASGCVARLRPDLTPPERPGCTDPSFVLDEVPEDLRVSDLANVPVDRLFVIAPPASPRALPPLQAVHDRYPTARGDPVRPFLGALLATLALALVVARARWRLRRSAQGALAPGTLPAGPIEPAWLAASACDVHTLDARTSYRAAPPRSTRTARRFTPSLLRSVARAIVEVRPWLALALAVTLLLLGDARP